jgi:hypothetical protein
MEPVVLKLPVKTPKSPFVVSLSGRLQKGVSKYGVAWCANTYRSGFQYWQPKKNKPQPDNFEVQTICKDCFVIQLLDKGTVASIRKFESTDPLESICIELRNIAVEKIVIRDWTAADDPTAALNPERLIERFMQTPDNTETASMKRYIFSKSDTQEGSEK